MELVFGYTRAEITGRFLKTLIPPRFPRVRPMGAGIELTGRRKSGEEFPRSGRRQRSSGVHPCLRGALEAVTSWRKASRSRRVRFIAASSAADVEPLRPEPVTKAAPDKNSYDLGVPVGRKLDPGVNGRLPPVET